MISGNKSIDSDFYDNSGYHEINASHLRDFKSRFQKYRVEKIRDIYDLSLIHISEPTRPD